MKAVVVKSPGGPEQLEIVNLAVPKINTNQVLIKTIAAGVNRPDILQRRGLYNPPSDASKILGLEISGEIVEIGDEVPADLMGKKVASSDNKKYIDMSNLKDGMYNIIVEYKELLIHKLIIKNGKTY